MYVATFALFHSFCCNDEFQITVKLGQAIEVWSCFETGDITRTMKQTRLDLFVHATLSLSHVVVGKDMDTAVFRKSD